MAANHSHHHFHVGLVVLAVVAAVVGYRFITYQNNWTSYVEDSQKNVMGLKTENSAEDARLIAETIVSVPVSNPMINSSRELQAYVEKISGENSRDVVITDTTGEILASTIAGNVGSVYSGDENGEVAATITDGQVRTFVERSEDHPDGVERTVIQFKNLREQVAGAIVISNSQIFE